MSGKNFFADAKPSANRSRRRNLQVLFNNTTLVPFKWRGKYMCFFCGEGFSDCTDLREHTNTHRPFRETDRAIKLVKSADSEVKVDVSVINCVLCEKSFDSFDKIVDHLSFGHQLPYDADVRLDISRYRLADLKCLHCGQRFAFFNKLVNHVNKEHPVSCFVCGKCDREFNKKRDLEAHARSSHRDCYPCSSCSLSFPSDSELKNHKTNDHSSVCNICFMRFPSNGKRLEHMKVDHASDGLQCGFCLKVMTTRQGFLRHASHCTRQLNKTSIERSVNEQKPSVKLLRNSLACILNMSTAIPFKHYLGKFRCFYCTNDFVDSDDLKRHTLNEHPLCDVRLKSMRLRNRDEGCIKIDTSSLSCKVCFEPMADLVKLVDHLIAEHKAKIGRATHGHLQPYKLMKDRYPCPICGEVFRYFASLLKHVSKAHAENGNVCAYCGICFRTHPSLRAHVSNRHKNASVSCERCNRSFPSRMQLQTHMGKSHGAKLVPCAKCGERFISRYTMQRHLIRVHASGHPCPHCGKLFVRNSFMIDHVRRTHIRERNVECPLCRDRFFDAQRLKMHMVKHYGERNFHCDVCGKRFLWKKNLRGHMTSHNRLDETPQGTRDFTSERRRRNLQILFNNTSILPFKWRGKYLCFYCGKSCDSHEEFGNHTRSHGPCSTKDYSLKLIKGSNIEIKVDVSDIACDICAEEFGSLNEIIDHLVEKHDMDYDKRIETQIIEYRLADFRCLYCEQSFLFFANLVRHVNNVHPRNSFVCDECGVSFNKIRDLALHLRRNHHPDGYSCDECSIKFPSQTLLKSHRNDFHYRKCVHCDCKFPSHRLLSRHVKCEHPDDGKTKCPHCLKQFHSPQGLKQHMNKCKFTIKSNRSEANFTTDGLLQPRKKRNIIQIRQNIQCVLNMSTATPFKFFVKYCCFYCSRKFVEIDELKEHTVSEHPVCDLKSKSMKKCKGERITVKVDVNNLACRVCREPMEDLDALIDHLIERHDANYDKSVTGCLEPYRVIKDNMPCPICPDRTFRYFGILLRHINSEHSDNNRICDFCGKSFKKISNLTVHISYAHTGDCECDACGIKFKNQWCLNRHKARIHDAKDYKCPKCPELFPSQYHKQKHLIKVHDIGHKCTHCGKMFTRNSFMKDHIRRTHLKEKNVVCSVCNERFFDNYHLKLHMVKHEGERKYVCDVCGKAFLRRSNLNSHKEMHKKYGHT